MGKLGRPKAAYSTVQIRAETETANELKMLAAISRKSVPGLMRDWLLPIVRKELQGRLRKVQGR